MKKIFIHISILLFCFGYKGLAQDANPPIKIVGTIKSRNGINDFTKLIVVNQTTGHGFFGNQNGNFELDCRKNDTIVISVIGYDFIRLCYKDSVLRDVYYPQLKLKYIEVNLKEVTVFGKRDLEKIYRDIEKLGYNEKDYKLSGVNAVSSPITFLYQQYSHKERAKRLAIELQNEENKRDILKELFAQYVDAKIIDLDKNEFEQFIDFCKVSDFLLQNTTQYEFILIIKDKFKQFKKYGY